MQLCSDLPQDVEAGERECFYWNLGTALPTPMPTRTWPDSTGQGGTDLDFYRNKTLLASRDPVVRALAEAAAWDADGADGAAKASFPSCLGL